MVILSSWMVVITECVYYAVLCGLLIYIGKIHQHSFLIGMLIAMPVMVVISILDLLGFVVSFSLLFTLLRLRYWRKNSNRRNWEIFVFVLVLLINLTVMTVWSTIEIGLFHPDMNVTPIANHWAEWIFDLSGYVADIAAAIGIKRILSKVQFTKRELGIIIPQMIYVLATMLFVIEYLRIIKIQGIYQLLILAFLLSQVGYSMQRTISLLRKDKQRAEISAAKQQLESMSVYTKQLEQSYEQTRKFRHDFKNLLLAIGQEDTSNGQSGEYLAALRKYSDQALSQNVLRFSDLTRIQVPALKTFIMTKLTLAQQKGIEINFECINPVEKLMSDEISIIRILGILLDNAIEASMTASSKRLNLLIISNPEQQEIVIENTFADPLPDLKQMNKLGFSTKGNDRGYGLANVKEILDQHPELCTANYTASDMFGTSLMITKETIV